MTMHGRLEMWSLRTVFAASALALVATGCASSQSATKNNAPLPDEEERLRLWRLHLRPGLPVAAQLRGELGGHMAYVRDFCRRRFGRPLLITRETGNLADVALTPELSEDVVAGILARNGFQNVSRAAYNLRQLLVRRNRFHECCAWCSLCLF